MRNKADKIIRILVSFSGGRTSSVMTEYILKKYKAYWNEDLKLHVGSDPDTGSTVHILVVFANTSREKEETLQFVNNCDIHLGFKTIWIESVQFPNQRKGAGFKVVNFHTACRNGDVFKAVIEKHGIPNNKSLHCTRELKERPIQKLCRSYGWKEGMYFTAIRLFRCSISKRYGAN